MQRRKCFSRIRNGFSDTVIGVGKGEDAHFAVARALYCRGTAAQGSACGEDIVDEQYVMPFERPVVGDGEDALYVLPALVAVLVGLCLVGLGALHCFCGNGYAGYIG